jgi:hypothetical protein
MFREQGVKSAFSRRQTCFLLTRLYYRGTSGFV